MTIRGRTAAVLCVASVLAYASHLPAQTAGTLSHPARPAAPSIAHIPIIDAHLHAVLPGHGRTVQQMLHDMDANGVVMALLMASDTAVGARWRAAAPGRFVLGAVLPCPGGRGPELRPCFPAANGWPKVGWVTRQLASGGLNALGEVLYLYYGIAPTDPRLEPYWAAAERFDVPVVVHTGRRPRSTLPASCCAGYDDDLGNPALLEPVLRRHPRLRISLGHSGLPFVDEAIALMKAHPNVYADLSVANYRIPEARYATWLRRLADAGLLDRIMFGSDNLPYAAIIARTDSVAFLTEAQRRGIYCENAARFLRLDAGVCAPR